MYFCVFSISTCFFIASGTVDSHAKPQPARINEVSRCTIHCVTAQQRIFENNKKYTSPENFFVTIVKFAQVAVSFKQKNSNLS